MINFPTKTDASSTEPAAEYNSLTGELLSILSSFSITPDIAQTDQIAKVIASYSLTGQYFADSGSANTYVLSPVPAGRKVPAAYLTGMIVKFVAANASSGASTVNVGSLGVKNIKKADGVSAIAAGDIVTTGFTQLWYDGTNFRLQGSGAQPTQFVPSAANALAGSAIQVQYTQDTSYQTTAGTVSATKDAVFPNTEGGLFLTRTFTPNSATNLLKITVTGYWQENTNTGGVGKVGVFQNGVTNALALGWFDATAGGAAGGTNVTSFTYFMVAGTTSAITFTVRAGVDAGQTDMNGYNGGRAGGGALTSSISVEEFKV